MTTDITLCCGQGCPSSQTCLRCTSPVMGRQDFFATCPWDFSNHRCEYYWSNAPSDEKIRQRAYRLWEESGCESGNAAAHWFRAQQQLIDEAANP